MVIFSWYVVPMGVKWGKARWVLIGVLGAAGLAAPHVVRSWKRPLGEDQIVDVGSVPRFETSVPLEVRNRQWWSSVSIGKVELSCGCVQLESSPREVERGGQSRVSVRIVPSLVDKSVESSLTIFASGENGGSGRPLVRHTIRASVIDPFEGFPDRATLHLADGVAELRIDDAYLHDPFEAKLVRTEDGWSVPLNLSEQRTLRASLPSEALASDGWLLELAYPTRGSVFRAWARFRDK